VDDAVSAMILMINNGINSRFNVCPDDELNVAEVAGIVMRACGIIKPVRWLGDKSNWKGDNKIIRACNHKIKKIGWNPKYLRSEDAIIAAVKESLC
jgi:nucleoside-diphosphate-sugar epimerase